MCAEFKKNIKTVPDACAWDWALDTTSFVWLWKIPKGQIGLNGTLLPGQPPKPHPFSQSFMPTNGHPDLCPGVAADIQKFLCLPRPLAPPREDKLLPLYKRGQVVQKLNFQTWGTPGLPISVWGMEAQGPQDGLPRVSSVTTHLLTREAVRHPCSGLFRPLHSAKWVDWLLGSFKFSTREKLKGNRN